MLNSTVKSSEETNVVDVYSKLAVDYINKFIRGIPNGLTLANLTCGLFSLVMSINGFNRLSALFIFLAALCDFCDGRVARMLRVTSDIGAQLDSLADIVSFGVAPAILAHSIEHWTFLLFVAFICFPIAGAWRLARFNANPTHGHFIGLPIPAAGIIVAFLALFSYVSPIVMIGLSLLMVSQLQIPKL